jgi:hypothetical protein
MRARRSATIAPTPALHRPCLCWHRSAGLLVYPAHKRPAIEAPLPLRCGGLPQGAAGGDRRQDQEAAHRGKLARLASPCTAIVATGVRPARQLSQKFAAYPRQHDLAVALHAIGRVERKLCIVECQLDADRLCRAQIGLKKGGSPRPEKSPAHRPPRGNPRPNHRRAALPQGRAQPARRDHHLSEHQTSRACRH